jgi:hypothetical protein
MQESPLQGLTLIIPLHTEIDWYVRIQPDVRKILDLGAEVYVGVNMVGWPIETAIQINASHRIFEFGGSLNAGEHWTALLQQVKTPFFRYWFAGDQISIDNLVEHVATLKDKKDISFVFSGRSVHYNKMNFHGQLQKRLKYWGDVAKYIDREQFLFSVAANGTNYIGEPSFVTFRTEYAAKEWRSNFGYVIEFDFYHTTLMRAMGYWLPASAGSFGISTNSGSFSLIEKQHTDILNWMNSVNFPFAMSNKIDRKIWLQYRLRRFVLKSIFLYEKLFGSLGRFSKKFIQSRF